MDVSVLGIDVGKSVFHVFGVDGSGHPSVRRTLTRKKLFEFLVDLPVCLVAAGVIAVTRRGARFSAHLSTLEMGLVTIELCMVVSASTTILWKIFGA